LVRARDLPWRTAHQIFGIMIRLAEERGIGPDGVTPALLDEAAVLYHEKPAGLEAAAIRTALDPERFIAARSLQGGPAPAESLRQADLLTAGLAGTRPPWRPSTAASTTRPAGSAISTASSGRKGR
jgi:argininosuccinate lyase